MSLSPFPEDREFPARLGKELQIEVERVEELKALACGSSGAEVSAICIHDKTGQIHLAVLKTSAKEPDLAADARGAQMLRGSWLDAHIPSFVRTVALADGRSCVVSAFAGGTTTKVRTLKDLMQQDQETAGVVLRGVVDLYAGQTLRPAARKTASPRELMLALLHDGLRQKIERFPWADVGLNPKGPGVLINGRVCPNPLFALLNPDVWNQGFKPSVAWVPIHGDLNAENILRRENGQIVLIDFEKTRQGLPLYDLAFLFCWLLQKIYLDRRDAAGAELDLAQRFVASLDLEQAYRKTADTAALAPAVEELFRPLCGLAARAEKEKVTAPEWIGMLVRVALAAAALARAFYELRPRKSEGPRAPDAVVRARRDGYFYFALSCLCLATDDLVVQEKIAEDCFSLPVQPTAAVLRQETYDAALGLRIRCNTVPQRSFATRLVWRIPLSAEALARDLPGWRRYTKVEQYSYLSKINLETNKELWSATEDVLVWADSAEGARPLIFELEKDVFPGKLEVRWTGAPMDLQLVGIDLVPALSGTMGWLGFRFEGGPCVLREYLTWLSSRSFGGLELVTTRGSGCSRVKLGRVMDELRAALAERRRPVVEADGPAPTGVQPLFFQLVLAENWPGHHQYDVWDLAWRLLASASRPRPPYPKQSSHRPVAFFPDHAENSCYGTVPAGVTCLAHGQNAFNSGTRANVFGEAEYLLWLIAQGMRELDRSDEDAARLARSMTEPRMWLFKHFWDGTAR